MTEDSGYDLEQEAGIANENGDPVSTLAPQTDPLVALIHKIAEEQQRAAALLSDIAWSPRGEPDYERAREDQFRLTALDHAMKWRARGEGPPISPEDTVKEAETFFAFLKGESK